MVRFSFSFFFSFSSGNMGAGLILENLFVCLFVVCVCWFGFGVLGTDLFSCENYRDLLRRRRHAQHVCQGRVAGRDADLVGGIGHYLLLPTVRLRAGCL